jgi:hypothetical protein
MGQKIMKVKAEQEKLIKLLNDIQQVGEKTNHNTDINDIASKQASYEHP